jgi:hypothetical protein
MNQPPAPARWRFRLKILTALPLFLLLVMLIQTRSAVTDTAARRKTLINDLRRFSDRQAAFHETHGRYAELGEPGLDFTPTAGTVIAVQIADRNRWSAIATDPLLRVAPATCGIYGGDASASPHRSVIHEAQPNCW